jgi:flagellar protein FlaG
MDVTRIAPSVANTRQPANAPQPAAAAPPEIAPAAPVVVAPVQPPSGEGSFREEDRSSGDRANLRRIINEINTTLETYGRHLGIQIHEATGKRMITVYDSETNEAIREIPPRNVLDAHAGLLELAGLLLDRRG